MGAGVVVNPFGILICPHSPNGPRCPFFKKKGAKPLKKNTNESKHITFIRNS
jgi:hypothetical protein